MNKVFVLLFSWRKNQGDKMQENQILTTKNKSRQLYGRTLITADYKQEDLNEQIISKILAEKFALHEKNAEELNYLYNYYKGKQPILEKTKTVRENINNIVLENNDLFAVGFKKGYVFGVPIQYVQRGDTANNEVLKLNSYITAENKHSKDLELAERLYIGGVALEL